MRNNMTYHFSYHFTLFPIIGISPIIRSLSFQYNLSFIPIIRIGPIIHSNWAYHSFLSFVRFYHRLVPYHSALSFLRMFTLSFIVSLHRSFSMSTTWMNIPRSAAWEQLIWPPLMTTSFTLTPSSDQLGHSHPSKQTHLEHLSFLIYSYHMIDDIIYMIVIQSIFIEVHWLSIISHVNEWSLNWNQSMF